MARVRKGRRVSRRGSREWKVVRAVGESVVSGVVLFRATCGTVRAVRSVKSGKGRKVEKETRNVRFEVRRSKDGTKARAKRSVKCKSKWGRTFFDV